jgi:1-acyl-sn-glycerol-3-phosphate acyltransferase
MTALIRSLLWTDPVFFALTALMGSLSLGASLVDGTGRLQHRFARRWARMALALFRVNVAVTGVENLTPGQAYVFTSNHLSLVDTLLVFGYLPWEFRILARKGLWSVPFLGWHLRRAGHMPVARDDARAGLRSLTDAAARVRAGMSVVVFPEGGRSEDGTLGEFKPGAAYVALKAGVPIAPFCILGTREVHTKGSVVVRPGCVGLHLGRPIPTCGRSPREARQLTAELRKRVVELLDKAASGELELRWNQCMERIAQGDGEALGRLYDGTHSLVYGLALRILGDTADAEEVTLDVYSQVWKTAGNFDLYRGTVSAWLVMLARSRAIDRLRAGAARRQREETRGELPDAPASTVSPEEVSLLSQQRRLVRAALDTLAPEQREAIELAFFSGLSHSELASRLGQPLGTVKTRIRLGMMKLRELLGGPCDMIA